MIDLIESFANVEFATAEAVVMLADGKCCDATVGVTTAGDGFLTNVDVDLLLVLLPLSEADGNSIGCFVSWTADADVTAIDGCCCEAFVGLTPAAVVAFVLFLKDIDIAGALLLLL